jgi:hypothetical protein
MRTAYAVCFFRVEGGKPVFDRVGIFSSSAGSITCERRFIPMDVAEASGETYEEAMTNLRTFLASWGDRYAWFLEAVQ